MTFFLLISACYLMGAVPFGLLIPRLIRHIDVRMYGSGNTGVTNVLRTLGVWPAVAVLILDVGKGSLAILIAKIMYQTPSLEVAAGLSVLVGHNWPIFLRFRGGKGVAAGIGSVYAISPLAGLIVTIAGLPFIAIFRYVSLGSIIGAITALASITILALFIPSATLGVPSLIYILYPGIGVPIILLRHRENISRLINGQERRLGESADIRDSAMKASN